MNKRETKPIKRFPFRLYFKQLFSRDIYVKYINPFGFWRKYRIEHLENCCQQDMVQYLERCYQLWRSPKPADYRKKVSCRAKSFDQSSLNTILIIRPLTKLKYRSVTYQTRRFIVASVYYEPLNKNSFNLDNYRQSLDVNSIKILISSSN